MLARKTTLRRRKALDGPDTTCWGVGEATCYPWGSSGVLHRGKLMKFTSQIIAAGSGSIGGCTVSRNRSGMYMRNRAVPVNPSSSFQTTVRGALATLVARWSSVLTPTQRSGWDTWAANTPQTDSLGNPVTITGQNAYIKMNTLRIQTGLSVVDVAPIIFANAVLTPPGIVSATAATEALSISFTNTDAWATAVGGRLIVFTGRPQNASKQFFKGPYRFAGFVNGAATPPTSPQSITAAFPFDVGQRVHVKFRAVNVDSRISTVWRASALGV